MIHVFWGFYRVADFWIFGGSKIAQMIHDFFRIFESCRFLDFLDFGGDHWSLKWSTILFFLRFFRVRFLDFLQIFQIAIFVFSPDFSRVRFFGFFADFSERDFCANLGFFAVFSECDFCAIFGFLWDFCEIFSKLPISGFLGDHWSLKWSTFFLIFESCRFLDFSFLGDQWSLKWSTFFF